MRYQAGLRRLYAGDHTFVLSFADPTSFSCGSASIPGVAGVRRSGQSSNWRQTARARYNLRFAGITDAGPDEGIQNIMAKRCEICGKGPVVGRNISHAHNVTPRRFEPNLQRVRALVNGGIRRLRVCTRCLRSNKVVKAA